MAQNRDSVQTLLLMNITLAAILEQYLSGHNFHCPSRWGTFLVLSPRHKELKSSPKRAWITNLVGCEKRSREGSIQVARFTIWCSEFSRTDETLNTDGYHNSPPTARTGYDWRRLRPRASSVADATPGSSGTEKAGGLGNVEYVRTICRSDGHDSPTGSRGGRLCRYIPVHRRVCIFHSLAPRLTDVCDRNYQSSLEACRESRQDGNKLVIVSGPSLTKSMQQRADAGGSAHFQPLRDPSVGDWGGRYGVMS